MPRVGLTRERVTDEAAIMADEVGLDNLTLAALAGRLGVRQPSLYKHIDSLAGLRRDVGCQSKREVRDILTGASVGRSGPDAIRSMSLAYRAWAIEHPARYQAANAVPAPGDVEDEALSLAVIQVIADVLKAYALQDEDSVDAIRAFRSVLHGFIAFETTGSFRWKADIDRSFARLVDGFILALAHWGELGETPATPAVPTDRNQS